MRPTLPRPRRSAVAAFAAALLSACAIAPIEPDRSAKAPELSGFGEVAWRITTASPEAQRWFTAGVLQAYAFNETEAVRMFKAALAQDPACAMCAWGVAWQLGPNINSTSRQGVAEALRYIELAQRHRAALTPREAALLDAMALRYGHGSQREAVRRAAVEAAPLMAARCAPGSAGGDVPTDNAKADPLDLAYAERLGELQARDPLDPQLLSLWAEAEMVATRADWWTGDGPLKTRPTGRIGDVAAALERGLAATPGHTGLNHYLIHAVDARGVAERAEAAADRLGALAPASPHLVHMPSHTYGQIGRYADAERVNAAALKADLALMDLQKAQGFKVSKDWRGHNQHYLWFAALMQGRGDSALQAARELAGRSKGGHPWSQYQRSLPQLTLLRLGRWDAVLAEPAAPAEKAELQRLFDLQARGVARLRRDAPGDRAEAVALIAQAEALAQSVRDGAKAYGFFAKGVTAMTEVVVGRLQAERASAEGRHDEALQRQAAVVKAAADLDDSEPPMLAAAARSVLGELQLKAGRPALAEASFRDDLARWPASGWALAGLGRALQAQGKAAEAQALQTPLDRAWAQADAGLKPTLR